MFEVPTNDQPPGMVLEVVQHGYALHDRLLRPAMVGVSKATDTADPAPEKNNQNCRGLRKIERGDWQPDVARARLI